MPFYAAAVVVVVLIAIHPLNQCDELEERSRVKREFSKSMSMLLFNFDLLFFSRKIID
jgi:hypothetical protein